MGLGVTNRPNPLMALIARGSVSNPTGGSSGGKPSTGSTNGATGQGEGPEQGAGTGNRLDTGGGQSSFTADPNLIAGGRAGRHRYQPRPAAPPPARTQAPPPAPARDFDAEVGKIGKELARFSSLLNAEVQSVNSLIKQWVKPNPDQVLKLIQVESRLKIMIKQEKLNTAMAPVLSHLRYVLNHPANQGNTKLLNHTRTLLKQAEALTELPALRQQLANVRTIINAHKTLISTSPVLQAMSKLMNIIGSVGKGVESASNSPASNPALRAAGGAATGATVYGLMIFGGPTVLADEILGTNMLSGSVNNTVDTIAAFTDVLLNSDIRKDNALTKLLKKNESGGNGVLVQAATKVNAALDAVLKGDPKALNDFVEGCLKSPNFLLRFGAHLGEGAQMWTTPEGRESVKQFLKDSFNKLFGR